MFLDIKPSTMHSSPIHDNPNTKNTSTTSRIYALWCYSILLHRVHSRVYELKPPGKTSLPGTRTNIYFENQDNNFRAPLYFVWMGFAIHAEAAVWGYRSYIAFAGDLARFIRQTKRQQFAQIYLLARFWGSHATNWIMDIGGLRV